MTYPATKENGVNGLIMNCLICKGLDTFVSQKNFDNPLMLVKSK